VTAAARPDTQRWWPSCGSKESCGSKPVPGPAEGCEGSVVARAAVDATTGLRGLLAVAAVHAGGRGAQAAAAGPRTQPLDLLGGCDRDGHDVVGGLDQRDVEQGGQPAARLDLGPGPGGVVGPVLRVRDGELPSVHGPDGVLLGGAGQVEEEDAVEA